MKKNKKHHTLLTIVLFIIFKTIIRCSKQRKNENTFTPNVFNNNTYDKSTRGNNTNLSFILTLIY